MDALTTAATDLLLDWLNAETGRDYRIVAEQPETLVADGDHRLSLSVATLFPMDADSAWSRRCDALSGQLGAITAVPFALWIPPEADLPHGDRSDFAHRIAAAATALAPGERGQVEFPVTLSLKKSSTEASYVHVIGGLAPHWAKLTGRAYGQYVLDATPIHRLPEPEGRVADLLEWVALLGNGMKAGAESEIKAEDAWTVRRSRREQPIALIGAPPAADPTNGTNVRRLLRNALRLAPPPSQPGIARALVLVGVFRTMAEENATIALRSCDPSLFGGFDLICLECDGQCKTLLAPRWEKL